MAVDLDKMAGHFDDYLNRGESSSGTVKIPPGKSRYYIVCPPHDNMEGMAYVQFMYHNREVPTDMQGGVPFSTRCQRDSFKDQELGKCWPCKRWRSNRKKSEEKDDKYDKLAQQYSPRPKCISQAIDVTPCFNKKGELKRQLKKCFGKHGKVEEDCDECKFNETCESFVQKWYMPVSVWEGMMQYFKDYGDITSFDKPVVIRVTRKGKGLRSRYTSDAFPQFEITITKGISKRILKALKDLTKEDPKPTGSAEELKKFYKDFYTFADVDDDDDDDDDDDEAVVRHPRKKKGNKEKKKPKSKNKEKSSGKKSSKNKKNKGKTDKLRKNLKKKAKKGKLDRDDDELPW